LVQKQRDDKVFSLTMSLYAKFGKVVILGELAVLGGTYYIYRELTINESYRAKMEDKVPWFMEAFHTATKNNYNTRLQQQTQPQINSSDMNQSSVDVSTRTPEVILDSSLVTIPSKEPATKKKCPFGFGS
jgi:mevalonate kinase